MLRCEDVRKSFYDPGRGEVRAVDGLDLDLGEGVVALVGANGAGKSTLLRLVATLLKPDAGRVLVGGLDTTTQADAVRARLGYLSTTTRLYPRLTAIEQLRFCAGFFPLSPAVVAERIAAMVATFRLDEFLQQAVGTLSTGQLQRLNLARTLLADPDVLILDEPTTGLDLPSAHQLVEAVRAAKRPGRLTIFATHIATDVARVADQVLVVRRGRAVFLGPPAELAPPEALEGALYRLVSPDQPATA